jgi:glycosyltransferase involved in cell wall biosynthesis
MRILYLADIRFPLERANGIQTIETCHALARRGHHVTLLVRPDTHQPARDPLAFYDLPPIDTLTIARVPVRGTAILRRAQYVAAAIRRARARGPGRDFDVVFTRDLGIASALLRWPRKRRPPVVYESHGYAPVVSGLLPEMLSTAPRASRGPLALTGLGKAGRLARRERHVWREAEGYVTITAALARELQERIGDVRDVHVVPDGARITTTAAFDWIGPRGGSSDVSPASVAGRGSALAVYAGHLYPWKGVDVLIEALALAPSLRARIVGGHAAEPDLGRLQARSQQLGLAGRVEFTGFQPPAAVAGSLRDADVLVLPNKATMVSARYTSPLKLFEYLAAGRPIVASDLPALREVLRDNENARLVPPDDPRALADALLALTRDAATAVRLARGAFETASEYSWDRRAERLDPILQTATDLR